MSDPVRSGLRCRRSFVVGLAIILCTGISAFSQASVLSVNVSQAKAKPGEDVDIIVRSGGREKVHGVVLEPSSGLRALELRDSENGSPAATIPIGPNSPNGLYVVHVWTGDRAKPSAVAKTSFRVGNIVADFFVANYVDKEKPALDLDAYLKDFRSVGGNFLIAHNLIIQAGAFYPSGIAKNHVGDDIVELLLDRADRQGIPILLSVSWDMTRDSPYKDRMHEIRAITTELYNLYRHHPSLAGFYSYQEGSGTYYAPFIREFSGHVKSLDRGLLTACAPHIDDPLLASYLSVIEDLDMMIYQSAVMASYRPDNRKEYPLRRVRDFSGLGAGAKRVENKIVLTHVELFAYMEKRARPEVLTASFNDIYGQILSAATVTDTDGIALFSYHAHIFDQSKRFNEGKLGRSAVEKGLTLFKTITAEVSQERNPLALYVPYSDFVIERWNNYFLPALDAFRKVGVPIDILPYAPPLEESVYPYYPFHMNKSVLDRLLREKTVLVLANVSGFQQTDSDLIKAFVEGGGVIVAFGPQIPFGRSYERRDLFGGEHKAARFHTSVTTRGKSARFGMSSLPSWSPTTAEVRAKYEDGSAAIVINRIGKGTVVTFMPDAAFASEYLQQLMRDALNEALTTAEKPLLLEMTGNNHDTDIAVRSTQTDLHAAIVNHNSSTRAVSIAFRHLPGRCSVQNGLGGRVPLGVNRKTNRIELAIPRNEVALLRCKD